MKLKFGGVHPNCESTALLVSTASATARTHYLKMPIEQLHRGGRGAVQKINPRLARLNPDKPLQKLWGRLVIITALAGLGLKAVNLRRILKGNRSLSR